MATKEFYRMDVVVDVKGESRAKTKLRAYDKIMRTTKKTAEALNKTKVEPKAKDKVSPVVNKIKSAMKGLPSVRTIVVSVIDRASSVISRVKNAVFSLPGMLGLGGAGASAVLGTKMMLDAAGFEESAKIGLKVMLKSKQLADETFAKAKRFADFTPFITREVLGTTTSLVSARFALKDIFGEGGILTDVGDLAAANQDIGASIMDVARAFARLKAGDYGEAFERLRDFKISRQDLREAGLKFSKSGEFQGTPEQAIEGVRKIVKKNFGGMMKEQSKSWFGMWSTFASQADNVLTAISKHEIHTGFTVFDAFKNRLRQITSLIIDEQGKLTPAARKFVRIVGEGYAWLDNKITQFFSSVKSRYLDNPAFNKLDTAGKINFVMGDVGAVFNKWWEGGGKDKVAGFGFTMGDVMLRSAAQGAVSAVANSPILALLLGAYVGLKTPGPIWLKVTVAISIAAAPWVKRFIQDMQAGKGLGIPTGETASGITAKATKRRGGKAPTETSSGMPDMRIGGFKKKARGGIERHPFLGMFAEAGPEAFIPLTGSRDRNLRLLGATAQALGAQGSGVRDVHIGNITIEHKTDKRAMALELGMMILDGIDQYEENSA